jgi:hypothetical protein
MMAENLASDFVMSRPEFFWESRCKLLEIMRAFKFAVRVIVETLQRDPPLL